MTLSILHRMTGLALAVALIGFVLWLSAIALGPAGYAAWIPWLSAWPAMLVYALAIVALVFHFCNGLRHLAWDMGWGYERPQARASAWVVVVATLVISALCVYFLVRHGMQS
jgi:succinate dehydrogenase / fumarate reductase cytochrome b subunit